jgi:hypothetical protein
VAVSYTAEVSRRSPTAFVVLVDQSGSMNEPFGMDSRVTKANFVSDVVNKWIDNLVIRASKNQKVRDYFEVAVLGYGGDVASALPGNSGLQPISAIADNPLRVEDRRMKVDDGAGGVIETPVKFRVWVDPRAEGQTPMCEALRAAADVLQPWLAENATSYPPTVINITDGQPSDGDPRNAATAVRRLGTSDGQVLLLNCHISGWGGSPLLYPSSVAGLPDSFAQGMFDISSELPDNLFDAAVSEGFPLSSGARGFGYQADTAALVKFIEIGTRPKDLVVAGE